MPINFKTNVPNIYANISDEFEHSTDVAHRLDERIRLTRIECIPLSELKPNPRNAKKHSAHQIGLLVENFLKFGITQPIVVDENNVILVGNGRYLAGLQVKLKDMPAVRLTYLNNAEKRALSIADNKLAELGEWDLEILADELKLVFDPDISLDFDARILGFPTVEIDQILHSAQPPSRADKADDFEDPNSQMPAVSELLDVWVCNNHRVVCGSALDRQCHHQLLQREQAGVVFADPPYNVPNNGHVTKRTGVREFEMARGEMSSEAFTEFLRTFCCNVLEFSSPGSAAYICMDWRHTFELRLAADQIFGQPKNQVVWVKPNAGMGSFYRSQHEMILVYGTPGGRVKNNFGLGGKGRYRSNVWKYPGFNSFGPGRDAALAMHPTVKPVALVADALMDCSNRSDIVLDPFGGSGTTMIAAERTGRRARLLELDPLYCDLIVKRWQAFSNGTARLEDTNETFNEVRTRRHAADRGGSE